MSETLKTTVNRKWLMKMTIFLIVLVGFGCWGFADAAWIYPNRGLEDASFKQRIYLEAAARAGGLGTASIESPEAKRATLEARRSELEEAERKAIALESAAAQSTPEGQRASAELRGLATSRADYAALQWFDALARVNRLGKDRTTFADGRVELDKLNEAWKSKSPPKPLASYDLPLQWFFTAAGFGGAIYLAILLIRVGRMSYQFEPATQRLTLPSGRTLVPADIAEFDKRKWDKFFIFLQFKDGSPELKLDLLRHAPLENWILEMEDTAFPDRAADRAATAAKAKAEEEAAALAARDGADDAPEPKQG